jgi:hypothetical protein
MNKARARDLDKKAFLVERVQPIPGWLVDFTAMRTMDLLDWQEEQGIKGSLLEIGVFRGRYFSLLLRSAERTGARAVGIDTFQWNSIADLRDHMAQVVGNVGFDAIQNSSSALTSRDLLVALGAPSRFVSVDGSHNYEDVLWDMAPRIRVIVMDQGAARKEPASSEPTPPHTGPKYAKALPLISEISLLLTLVENLRSAVVGTQRLPRRRSRIMLEIRALSRQGIAS